MSDQKLMSVILLLNVNSKLMGWEFFCIKGFKTQFLYRDIQLIVLLHKCDIRSTGFEFSEMKWITCLNFSQCIQFTWIIITKKVICYIKFV